MTTYTPEEIALAQRIACKVVMDYGEGDEREYEVARSGYLWNDHPAVQSALAAIRETSERAAKFIERFGSGDTIASVTDALSLLAGEHLK